MGIVRMILIIYQDHLSVILIPFLLFNLEDVMETYDNMADWITATNANHLPYILLP